MSFAALSAAHPTNDNRCPPYLRVSRTLLPSGKQRVLVTGTDGFVLEQDFATRAQAEAMMERLYALWKRIRSGRHT